MNDPQSRSSQRSCWYDWKGHPGRPGHAGRQRPMMVLLAFSVGHSAPIELEARGLRPRAEPQDFAWLHIAAVQAAFGAYFVR